MTTLKMGLIAGALVAAVSGAAFAGAKSYIPLTIDATNRNFYGGFAETHNTADTTQYAECGTSNTTGYCVARSSAGTYYSCVTSDAALIDTIRGLSPDSTFNFVYNTSGVCTYILEYASSRTAVRQ